MKRTFISMRNKRGWVKRKGPMNEPTAMIVSAYTSSTFVSQRDGQYEATRWARAFSAYVECIEKNGYCLMEKRQQEPRRSPRFEGRPLSRFLKRILLVHSLIARQYVVEQKPRGPEGDDHQHRGTGAATETKIE